MAAATENMTGRNHRPRGELAEVDVALEAWARWARSALGSLGWPPMTLLARVIAFGTRGAAIKSGITSGLEADALCELVERAIMRLRENERAVVIRRYLHWEAIEWSAKKCGMSPGQFRIVLHRARRSVSDYLAGMKEISSVTNKL